MTRRNQHKQTPPSQTAHSSPDSVKRFSDHISELRRRTFFVALVFLAASGVAYNYHDILVSIIMRPLQGEKLIYLTPAGGFNFIFQVSLYAGLLIAAPMLIHQLYSFIKPALPKKAHRSATPIVIAAFLLMLWGVAFGYFIAVPAALSFLATFAGGDIMPNLTADSYLSFFLAYIAGLGVLFELPLLLLFIHWIHPLTPKKLLNSERYVILFAFIIAAIISPTPDVYNQTMIAVPLIVIYQGGVITVWFAIRRERRRNAKVGAAIGEQPATTDTEESSSVPAIPIMEKMEVSAAQPAALSNPTAAPVQQKPVRRPVAMDGFRPAPRGVTVPPRSPAPKPGQRPQASSDPYTRPRLSVDGFLPM